MHLLKSLVILIFVLCCSGKAIAAEPAFYAPYGSLLDKYVNKGKKEEIEGNLVDYKRWGSDPLHKKAMQQLQKSEPEKLTGPDRMAFWINAYNLMTIDFIIKNKEGKSIKNLGSIFSNPWRSEQWEISGRKYTLDEIDREILRKMKEPRIHLALVQAALSSPDLRNEPYYADRLEDQLQSQAEIFLRNTGKGARVENNRIKTSSIFKWFKEDFGGQQGIERFIRGNFQNLDSDQLPIEGYIDFNWNLNSKSN